MMKHVIRTISLVALTVAMLAGCGKRGQLIPPEALVPAAVQDLQVRQKGADIMVSWQAPTREQSGRPLRDLAGFRLQRRDIAGDGSDCAACADSWKLLGPIDLDFPGETRQAGSTFFYFDRGPKAGRVSQYRLQALSRSGGSSAPAVSGQRQVVPAVAAPAIRAEALTASIRITLNFTAPAGAKLLGFNIYRRSGSDGPQLLPLNSAPLPHATWEDQQLQFGQTYRYSATALVAIAGESVESLASAEVSLPFTLQDIR